MTNGFGAGFGGLMLLAVLLVLAAIQSVVLLGVYAFRQWTGSVPGGVRYVSVIVLIGVILVGGFAVLASYDEAWRLAVLFLAVVFVPLAAVVVSLSRQAGLAVIDGIATAGLAWSVPFLAGVGVVLGFVVGSSEFGLATTAPEQQVVAWIAMAAGGVVVTVGAVLLGGRIGASLESEFESGD